MKEGGKSIGKLPPPPLRRGAGIPDEPLPLACSDVHITSNYTPWRPQTHPLSLYVLPGPALQTL